MTKEEGYNKGASQVADGIKRYVYDLITGAIMIIVVASSLHIFGVYDLSQPDEMRQFFVDWAPYFIASILLNMNLYEKGSFTGRNTENFKKINKDYSSKVALLDGKQLTSMSDFCVWYNEKSLLDLRKDILRKQGFSLDILEQTKFMTKKELKEKYTKTEWKAILAARAATVKGINTNVLLCSFNVKDATNIGKTENEMRAWHNIFVTVRYLFFTLVVAIIFIKRLTEWQWAGLIEVIFKMSMVLCRATMSYFKGYRNITINLSSHITRKCDILDIFDEWYKNKEQKDGIN